MKGNYLYWLGAGASAYSLPLVSSFIGRLEEFRNIVRSEVFASPDENSETHSQKAATKKAFDDSMEWLLSNLKEHASVDTFAKKLFFKNDQAKLKILKAVLSCFFVGEQSIRPVDYRYDSFFASILRSNSFRLVDIPEDIKFLLWNYDLQLEKAYYGYTEDDRKVLEDLSFNDKRLYHLNGYCGTTQKGHIGKEFKETFVTKKKLSKVVLDLYADYVENDNSKPDINFAWEMNENYFNNRIGRVTNNVNKLIIIGYSFPFFNREIDKKIFSKLCNLDEIFVQIPNESFAGIKERMAAIEPNLPEPKHIEDTSQFYIPLDYNL
jgi:hypothetical protein